MPTLSAEALRIIMDYEWPGNVRELENAMERGVVLATTRTITPDLLPASLTGNTYSASLLDHKPDASLFDLMEEIERRIIADRLERCHWNQTEAAEYFRIPLSDAEPEDQAAECGDQEAGPGVGVAADFLMRRARREHI